MKKIIAIFCAAFLLGVIGYNLIPKIKVVSIEGEIPLRDKTDLIIDSDIIVRGKVQEIKESKWSNTNLLRGKEIRNILQTDIVISVDEILKGQPYDNKTVSVRINKGSLGNTVVNSDGYPDFKNGENAILFLSKDDSDVANLNENYYVLTGMCQGKYLESKLDKNSFISSDGKEDKILLSSFKEDIKSTLEKEKNNPKTKMSKEEISKQNEKLFGK